MQPTFSSSHFRALILLFTFGLVLRLGYLAMVWAGPLGNADSPAYKALATALSHGRTYETELSAGPGGFPTDLQRPPGYPEFLALVNSPDVISNRRTAVVQCLIGAIFAVLLAYLAGSIINPSVNVFAGLCYAADWVTIVHTPMVIAETVYSVTLGLAILLFTLGLEKRRDAFALLAGLFLGVAALIKPAAQLVLLAFLIGWLFQKDRRWTTLLFLFTYLVCVAPWMMRNERKYGVATLSEIAAADLYFYTAQGGLHSYRMSDLAGTEITNDVSRLDKDWRSQALSVGERSGRMRQDALQVITAHWPAVLMQATIGFGRTSIGTAFVSVSDSLGAPPGWVARIWLGTLPLVQVVLLWAMAIYGCVAPRVLSRGVRNVLIASVFCILLPSAAPLAQSRFRVPAVPGLSVLAAAGAKAVKVRLSGHRTIEGVGI